MAGTSSVHARPPGLIPAIVEKFLEGPLAFLFLFAAGVLGASAVLVTPREEEPQIVVPVADVYVQFPGASPEEVERLVSTPLERLLWQIDGVEYVYSTSRRGLAVVTVRFHVGEDREDSLVKLQNKIESHRDVVPSGVTGWVVKPVEIDDVPIVTLTLHSDRYDDHELRRIGEEVLARLESLEDISRTRIVGGRRREVAARLDPDRMKSRGVGPLEVRRALAGADASRSIGDLVANDREISVVTGPFLASAADVGAIVVAAPEGRPVHVRDVADVIDGPEEVATYTRIGFGPRDPEGRRGSSRSAITLAIAKKRGTNAVAVADRILERTAELRGGVIPDEVEIRVTRNHGRTADAKVDELLGSLFFAMATVVVLLFFTLGWREALIVALAVPVSFGLCLFVNLLFGFTINRVTLFALILSLGLVVDDPITNVDNIQRHIRMGRHGPLRATLEAVREVLPPVVMSTLTIIVSFLPMFFITGMMGPYMRPMAANVPLAVTFSTVAALSVVPWATHRLLRGTARPEGEPAPARDLLYPSRETPQRGDVTPPWIRRTYARLVGPFIGSRIRGLGLVALVVVLLAASAGLALTRRVPLKMLPFDDKDELQILVDLPEGTSLERTDAVVRELEDYLTTVSEVTDVESYVGTPSPIDFNGLVRHYGAREGSALADLRVNLAGKRDRRATSHELALAIRRDLERIAARRGARIKIVETPPGPPVLATIVAEVYGPPEATYDELARAARRLETVLAQEPGLVDVDTTLEEPRDRLEFVVDKEKAALHGIATQDAVHTLDLVLAGEAAARIHEPAERQPVPVRLRYPFERRAGEVALAQTTVTSADGRGIELAELGRFARLPVEQPILHKNLERVVYVTADTAGRPPGEAVLDLQARLREDPLPGGARVEWAGEGEWKITLDVFRDLGIAFGAALLGIYVLLVLETRSFRMPLVIMTAIPLTAIGVLPGFWILNLIAPRPIDGFPNPVFFTATAMIGMIALGGIVVRNSIVLLQFIENEIAAGRSRRDAILASGAVRLRPILLTAATTALGAWPITIDPIFSGLAWSLIFGLTASTAFTLVVVPVVYDLIHRREPAR